MNERTRKCLRSNEEEFKLEGISANADFTQTRDVASIVTEGQEKEDQVGFLPDRTEAGFPTLKYTKPLDEIFSWH